jgi:hypothetical protein
MMAALWFTSGERVAGARRGAVGPDGAGGAMTAALWFTSGERVAGARRGAVARTEQVAR